MEIFLIIISIIFIITIILNIYSIKNVKKKNSQIELENKLIEKDNAKLKEINSRFKRDNEHLEKEYDKTFNRLNQAKITIDKEIEDKKTKAEEDFKIYCGQLNQSLEEEKEDWNYSKELCKKSYYELQRAERAELEKIKATRAAAIQALSKEKEIKENKDDFRLNLSITELNDIKILKSIQKDIVNSVVIDKIIWSNYYQPLAKVKFPKIIGKATTCGIYKITSLTTGAAYIGQSLDICDRWKQHCKNALGATAANKENKLYKAIREEGLNNFTFEVIEECEMKELDEKEREYIDLYDSYNFGLNGNRGNNR